MRWRADLVRQRLERDWQRKMGRNCASPGDVRSAVPVIGRATLSQRAAVTCQPPWKFSRASPGAIGTSPPYPRGKLPQRMASGDAGSADVPVGRSLEALGVAVAEIKY